MKNLNMDVALNQGGECYICLEKTIYVSPCNCKNRSLCENCYVKLLLYDYKQCTICKAEFPDMEEEKIVEPLRQRREPHCSYTPLCCRPRSERLPHSVSQFWADLLFHILIIFILTSFSCYLTMSCSGEGLLYNLLPCVLFYVVVTFMCGLVC